MNWSKVGDWVKDNAGTGAALVGSLITGGPAGAVAAGISMLQSATGQEQPDQALEALKNNPEALVKLKQIAHEEEKSIRDHLAEMTRLKLEDSQAQHHETQETVREGDKAKDRYVRWTRPTQASISLIVAMFYAFSESPNETILMYLLALPFAYAGLRQIGKGVDSYTGKITNSK